ncbi:cell division suppressor protein YneA [Cohnella yongneupensis]|uniref:LysM peptidoglycan-binding domain-containing protein n=1 Tax=Cohnella yongneupensis TaxID=425006 RepID=A0ABW0R3S1_9BACL
MVHTWVSGSSAPASTIHKMVAPLKPRYAVRTASATTRSHRGLGVARSLFIVIAFVILFSGFAFAHTFASSEAGTPASANEIVISVDSGDTLWELAGTYKKDNMDTREAVHVLMKRNGLASSSLHTGQTLVLPAKMLP